MIRAIAPRVRSFLFASSRGGGGGHDGGPCPAPARRGRAERAQAGGALLLLAELGEVDDGALVPWATGKPLYCQHLCPHGHAQELLARVAPKRWRIALPRNLAAGLRWLPALTLGFVIVIVMLVLPQDLAAVEPFDAYPIRAAGWAKRDY